MPGFVETEDVNKINIHKKKREIKPQQHLKVKNISYLNKAIRKAKAKSGSVIRFSDITSENSEKGPTGIEDIRLVVHCDGSLMNAERSKTQLGIIGMIMSKTEAIKYDPKKLGEFQPKEFKTYPTLRAGPIYWGSFKSPRVATSSFGAELQAIFHAVDLSTMLRCIVSELTRGHPRGDVQADVRNDGLNVINCVHGLTNIQQEKRLTATVETLREAIKLGDVNSVKLRNGTSKCS